MWTKTIINQNRQKKLSKPNVRTFYLTDAPLPGPEQRPVQVWCRASSDCVTWERMSDRFSMSSLGEMCAVCRQVGRLLHVWWSDVFIRGRDLFYSCSVEEESCFGMEAYFICPLPLHRTAAARRVCNVLWAKRTTVGAFTYLLNPSAYLLQSLD